MAMTKDEQLIRIKNEYRKAHNGSLAATLREMLEWASKNNLYVLDMSAAWSHAVDQFSAALRSEMTTDIDGNEIRVNLSFLEPQTKLWKWDQRDTISHEHFEINVQRGWRSCYSDIRANILSVNDYVTHHPDRPTVQFSLDFAGALADDGIKVPSSIEPGQIAAQPQHVA